MNNKDFGKMPILNQEALQSVKGIFSVDKNYNLNGSKIIIPKGMTIDLDQGSINNGTLVFNDTLLENMHTGCIDARIEGTLRNSVIVTSQIGGFNNLALQSYSGKTVYCDQSENNVNYTVILNDTNTSETTIFDGTQHSFNCNVGMFKIYGQSNIIIRNFFASANSSNLVFEEMITTSANSTNIQIYNNIIDGFKIGISLNCDSQNYYISNCSVYNNYVKNCGGTTSGNGYGIHMANARYCTITNNTVENCERHAIYHAYGEHNTISYNTIKDHCKNLTTYNLLSALEIGRKSKDVTVSHNTFINCNNICLLVYSPLPTNDGDGSTHLFRYGKCEDIVIENNTFNRGNLTGNIGHLPFIYIGVETTPYSTLAVNGKVVKNVDILNNTFIKSGGENQECIRVHQCEELTISGNDFQLGLPSYPQSNEYLVINIPENYVSDNSVEMIIQQNAFSYNTSGVGNLFLMGENMASINTSNNPNFIITWSSNTLLNQIIGGITRYQLSNNTPGNNFIYIP